MTSAAQSFSMVMKTLPQIKAEIERATERRTELWHVLSHGHDSEVAAEVKELEDRLQRLWDEERMLRAHLRFGDRDEIIKRARHEERLARAA
jgi:ABC-type phosphate transport system auxiliary subunit